MLTSTAAIQICPYKHQKVGCAVFFNFFLAYVANNEELITEEQGCQNSSLTRAK